MKWPFRRSRYVATEQDLQLLKATSVAHLATMPGSDVVVGTLFTDPLVPPEDDPDEFYSATPEAAPERRGARYAPLDRGSVLRLRTSILSCLDPKAHSRLWMALEGVSRWEHLEQVLDRELPASGGTTLLLTRNGPDKFVIVWTDAKRRTQRVPLVRGENF